MQKALTFSDVSIIPRYSEIGTRRGIETGGEIDLTSDFGPFKLRLPVFAANMKSICGPKMAIAMRLSGGMGILHRFCSNEDAVQDFLEVVECGELKSFEENVWNVGVSVGVQAEDKVRFNALYDAGARIFCIDIAHGHSKMMKDMIKFVKTYDGVYIIAGNIATGEGASDLIEWGANCVKVGIGPGAACETRKNTGVGVPQLTACEWVHNAVVRASNGRNIKIIADGGIRVSGDIPKALKYVDAVMVGSFIAGTEETPGAVFRDDNGDDYKVYQGSASGENKVSNGKPNEYVEGISLKVKFRNHVKYILSEGGTSIREGLQSSFSYVGARTLPEFKMNCDFMEMSSGGKRESKL
jgi:IMP dehydrogenase